jgi:hypothetical protein
MTTEDPGYHLIAVLLLLFISIAGFKILYLGYSVASVLPTPGYKVRIELEARGDVAPLELTAVLPFKNHRQTVRNDFADTSSFTFDMVEKGGNLIGTWRSRHLSDHYRLSFAFTAICKRVIYALPDSLPQSASVAEKHDRTADPVDITANEKRVILMTLGKLGLSPGSDRIDAIKKVHSFIFGEQSDRLTVSEMRVLSKNDRNRLFVSMMQTLGIPARLVGGFVLDPDRPGKAHRWAQVYLGDQWVPFDLTNQVFAELPENYLVVNYGEEPFFKCPGNTILTYEVRIERTTLHNTTGYAHLVPLPLNIMNAWPFLQKTGLSLELLGIMLTIPFGTVVIIILRNVIGLQTLGIFLPVLLAAAFGETGFKEGLLTFTIIAVFGTFLRLCLDHLKILHMPKLAIILAYIVFAFLGISILGMKYEQVSFGQASLFSLAMIAITIERFSIVADQSGILTAFTVLANTILSVILCYLAIRSTLLQALMLAFPEIILLAMSVNIYLGTWNGLKLSEWIRLRRVVFVE